LEGLPSIPDVEVRVAEGAGGVEPSNPAMIMRGRDASLHSIILCFQKSVIKPMTLAMQLSDGLWTSDARLHASSFHF
jgi:hypothetical protein